MDETLPDKLWDEIQETIHGFIKKVTLSQFEFTTRTVQSGGMASDTFYRICEDTAARCANPAILGISNSNWN